MAQSKMNYKTTLLYVLFIIVLVFTLSYQMKGENFHLLDDDIILLDKHWTVEVADGTTRQVSLPYKMNVEKGEMYTAQTVLPALNHNQDHLLLRSSMQDMIVEIDGKEIYRHVKQDKSSLHLVPASLWLLVPLPADSAGKTLTLHIISEVKAFSGVMNEVKLGSDSALLFGLLKEQWAGVLVFTVLFMVGITATIFSFIVKGANDHRLTYLGLFAASISIWIISEAKVLQLVMGNRFVLGSISYMMIVLIALFFVLYIKEAVAMYYKKVLQSFAVFYAVLLISIVGLQVFVGIPFIESIGYVLFCVVTITIVTFVLLMIELKKYQNDNVKKLFKYILILLAILLPEVVIFYLGDFNATSKFTRIGLLVFFLLLLRDSYFYLRESLEKMKEAELLERLAYKDFLTGGFNRAAFERDVQRFLNDEHDIKFRLVLMDLNHLKYINDSFGHQDGDYAIQTTFNIISKAFLEKGKSYRIGGDEFALLLRHVDDESYESVLRALREQLAKTSKDLPYVLDVGVGSAIYSQQEWQNFTAFYHHVDLLMYTDKKARKEKRLNEELSMK